jgi:hypothetical protein
MSLLSAQDLAKIDALTELIHAARTGAGPDVEVCELAKVAWPAPDATVFYASTVADEVWPSLRVKLSGGRVEPRLPGGQFLDVMRESGVSDESVSLSFWDPHFEVSSLFARHGEGVRVEIFFYFPQVDLLLSMFHGHLRAPEEADEDTFNARAESGFMSVQLPLPRRAFFSTCQAVFGGLLQTQAEIDEHDCPYNRHVGGAMGNLDPATGQPFTSCPRARRSDCTARLGNDLFFLAFDTVTSGYPVGSRGVIATSRGNESNLKRPLRVIAGERTVRDLDLLQHVVETGNPRRPEDGSIKLLLAVGEGLIDAIFQPKVNNRTIAPQHYGWRLGATGQPSTGFTRTVNNYSATALLNVVLQGDFRSVEPSQIPTEVRVRGLATVRHYSDETTFAEQYSTDRAFWLLECYRNKRWGLGADLARFAIEEDIIPLSEWFAENVSFTDRDGNTYAGPRSTFNAELGDRSAQQQITDICLAGRCTVPFPFEGKLRVFPLKKLSAAELAAAPVFADYGDFRNIVRDPATGKSSLSRSSLSDRDLPNAVKVTFDDAERNHEERPLLFDDTEQQLRAGRAFGDTGRRAVEKPYGLLGVTSVGEASRCGVLLRDLGPFDEGGLENNLRVRFQTFFTQALSLHKSKVIRVLSRQPLCPPGRPDQVIEYFRVRYVRQLPNLLCEISAQAYPVDYYEKTESPVTPVGDGGAALPNPGGVRGSRPRDVLVGDLGHTRDRIHFQLNLS